MSIDPEIDLTLDNLCSQNEAEEAAGQRDTQGWFLLKNSDDPWDLFFPPRRELLKRGRINPETGIAEVSLAEDDGSLSFLELVGQEFGFEDPYEFSLARILNEPQEWGDATISEGGLRCDRCGKLVRPWDSLGDTPLCGDCKSHMAEEDYQTEMRADILNSTTLREINAEALINFL
jgi:hypothetical protein